MFGEHRNNVQMILSFGVVQGSITPAIDRIDCDAELEQITQRSDLAFAGGQVQSRAPVIVAGIRIEPAGDVARYESRVADNHHHVICRGCGAIADVDCAVGDTPCLTASSTHGFTIDEAEVIYWGHCPDCAGARSTN